MDGSDEAAQTQAWGANPFANDMQEPAFALEDGL